MVPFRKSGYTRTQCWLRKTKSLLGSAVDPDPPFRVGLAIDNLTTYPWKNDAQSRPKSRKLVGYL